MTNFSNPAGLLSVGLIALATCVHMRRMRIFRGSALDLTDLSSSGLKGIFFKAAVIGLRFICTKVF